jgi:hypothetical protein
MHQDGGIMMSSLQAENLAGDLRPISPWWTTQDPSPSAQWRSTTLAHSIDELVMQVVRRVSAGRHWVASGLIPWWRTRRGFQAAIARRRGDSLEDARQQDFVTHFLGSRFVLTAARPFAPPAGAALCDVREAPVRIADYWVAAWCELGRWSAGASVDRGAAQRLGVSRSVPCHRVIAADGSLRGYGGGLELKARLLAMERSLSPGPRLP